MRWLAVPALGTLILAPLLVAGPAAGAATPAHDAGPTATIKLPSTPSGKKLDVTKYGATPGDDSDDDSTGFRSAIGAAKSGDEVVVPAGNYVFTTPNVVLKTGVSVRGVSGAVITAVFTSSTDNAGSSMFSAASGTSNFTISGLHLTSSGGAPLNNPLWIGGVSGSNVSRIAIRNMKIDNYFNMAIGIRNGDNVTVEDNYITAALATGGGGQGYGIMIGYPKATNNRVAGNTIEGPMIRHGILLQYYAHHNLVEDNTVSKTVYDAFDLHGEDEYSNELRDNTATDCGEGGFGVGQTGATHDNTGPKNWIHHNTVSGCKYGVQIYRNSDTQYVEDNTFTGNSLYGIFVHDEGARDLLFARNTVQDNGSDGVNLTNAPGVQLLDNVVTGNNGFALQTDVATTGYTITGNDFRGDEKGVLLGSPDGTYESNQDGTTSSTSTTSPTTPIPPSTTTTVPTVPTTTTTVPLTSTTKPTTTKTTTTTKKTTTTTKKPTTTTKKTTTTTKKTTTTTKKTTTTTKKKTTTKKPSSRSASSFYVGI